MTTDSTADSVETTDLMLLTAEEFAATVRAPIETIRYWRKKNYGPQGFRLGRRVLYIAAEVDAFIAEARSAADQRVAAVASPSEHGGAV